MLIPRFSLRLLLVLTTVSAVFFFVVAHAVDGHFWAIGVSVAGASLLLTLLVHAFFFFLAWSLTSVCRLVWRPSVPASPFAMAPPHHSSPPEEPE
jgi:hypothetical protein